MKGRFKLTPYGEGFLAALAMVESAKPEDYGLDVTLEEAPEELVHAVLHDEDEEFREHILVYLRAAARERSRKKRRPPSGEDRSPRSTPLPARRADPPTAEEVSRASEVMQQCDTRLIQEGELMIRAIEANLAVLEHVVGGVLSGDEEDLIETEEDFAEAVDSAIYYAARAAVEVIGALQHELPRMSRGDQESVVRLTADFERVFAHWSALVESVEHVWVKKRPPN